MKRSMGTSGIGRTGAASSFRAAAPSGEGWPRPSGPPRCARASSCARPRRLHDAAGMAGVAIMGAGAFVGALAAGAFDAQMPAAAQAGAFCAASTAMALIGFGGGWMARHELPDGGQRCHGGYLVVTIVPGHGGEEGSV